MLGSVAQSTGITLLNLCHRRVTVKEGRLPQEWGSRSYRHWRGWVVGWVEFLSVAGTERAVVDGTANLQEEIGPAPRPAHLLRFVHPAVDQEIGRPFGDRGANPQAGTVALSVVDRPVPLAG